MGLAFPGNYKKLKETVAQTGLPGKWRELKNGHKQFEQAFIAVASANPDSNEARR